MTPRFRPPSAVALAGAWMLLAWPHPGSAQTAADQPPAQVATSSPEVESAPVTWTDKETRLATEYLGLLVEKPDDERVLDLLWQLYDKQQQTGFLLESIAAQAAQQPHPNVILIHAHLLRRAGRLDEAMARYQDLLKQQPDHPGALAALNELLQQKGDPTAALAHLQKLIAQVPEGDPKRPRLLLQQASQLLTLNRPVEAAKACEQALQGRATDTALLREASQLLLGAGMMDKTLALMQRLVEATADPNQKLDALFDLARLQEQAGHFSEAAAALHQGLDLLHDKDWRYAQFFQRLVKLHERYDQLDALKQELLREAGKKPVTEKALNNLARYASQVVDSEERIKWLRELVTHFPANEAHRWELATALIDHNDAAEAAALIDAKLKRDGSDRPQLVLLRALAHLHLTETDQAIALLQQLLRQQVADLEVEKQVLAFARQKSLDPLIESILTERIRRQPGKPELLFELAAFQRTRGNHKAVDRLFDSYIKTSPASEKQRRLSDVASFLSSSPDLEAAEKAAREALNGPGAGRDELLRLSDILTQRSSLDEAQTLLERAWNASTNDEQRADVDERLASVLSGEQGAKLLTTPMEPHAEFSLPAMFSGEGFGSDAPVEKPSAVPETLTEYAQHLAWPALLSTYQPMMGTLLRHVPAPLGAPLWVFTRPAAPVDPLRLQRAAWWSLRTGQTDSARLLLHHLTHDAQGNRQSSTLEIEKLLLEVLLLNVEKEPAAVIAQLRRVADLDPASRTACLLRLSELEARRDGKQGLVTAISTLESLLRTEPENDAVLSALSQYYLESGQREKALALWENAARNSKSKSSPVLERYGELLIAQRRHQDFIQTQIRLIEQESDIKRRRDFFQRAIQRLLWADAVQGELPEEDRTLRLNLVKSLLLERTRREPFEGFWNEALAHIYELEGDDQKAFAAMKQAYYTAPDTPFSLEQLRVAALRVGDLKSAIYFQKQIAAAASATDQAGEWRQLLQLLESDFRMGEADLARRRLEARFSQDPAALDELARYYTETSQDEAARRVLEQLVRVKGWSPTHLLRLAIQQRKLGDAPAARATLVRLLSTIPAPVPNEDQKNSPELWPWPLFDENSPTPGSPTLTLSSLENAPDLEPSQRDRLRLFLSLPRQEFILLPTEPGPVRLRAIQELVTLPSFNGSLPAKLNQIEIIWANYHGQRREALREQLARHLLPSKKLEGRFLFIWLAFKSHNPGLVIDWLRKAPESDLPSRKILAQAILHVLSEDHLFHFEAEDMRLLGSSGVLSYQEIIDLANKLENRHDYDLALELGEAMRGSSSPLSVGHLSELARIAGNSGDEKRQHAYYREIWLRPLIPGISDPNDAFIRSFESLWGLNSSPEERAYLLRESLRRLDQFPRSDADDLRRARLLAIAGVTVPSTQRISKLFAEQLHTHRPFIEPIIGRLPPGVNPGPRVDPLTHMRDYWTELRMYSELLRTNGLSTLLPEIDAAAMRRNAGVALGPRATFEFNAWRNSALTRQLRYASFPERLRLVRQVLETDDSVDLMLDLGNLLESQGYAREAVEVFRRLQPRSPANEEYSNLLRRACDTAGESSIAADYLEKILPAQVHEKPQGLDETLREEHARHLARLHDLSRLRFFAYRPDTQPGKSPGRVPEQVPYLKELALMLELRNDLPGALASWEQLHRLWQDDLEASLHRAMLLQRQNNPTRALEALREIPLANFWNEPVREAFALRAQLAAQQGLWEEIREMMNLITGSSRMNRNADANGASGAPPNATSPPGGSLGMGFGGGASTSGNPTYTGGVLILSRVLTQYQRISEAQSLLLRAERSVRDDSERFKLRMEQLRISAEHQPNWSPGDDQPRVAAWLRAFTDDRDALSDMSTFLNREASSPRAASWLAALQHPNTPRHSITALALASFSPLLKDDDLGRMASAWDQEQVDATRENARELTVALLLNRQKPMWALQVATVGSRGGLRQSPAIIPVYQALNDRHSMEELFAQLVRTTFPGSSNVAPYAEAFAHAGRADLAGELYDLTLQSMRNSGIANPPFIESYARFLIRQHRYEQAENLLLKEHPGMIEGLASLLVELYRGWNRLDQLPVQLAKYHLPDAVLHEALFLAGQPQPPSTLTPEPVVP